MSTKLVVGLTGGIGSGKSTVANLFVKKGTTLVDTDVIARDVVKPSMPATLSIAERFGKQALLSDGNLDRQFLREKVFADADAKKWLDSLLHPLIRQEMLGRIERAKSAYCLVDVPLLTENGMQKQFNRVLVVDCSVENQVKRAMLRDGSSESMIKNIVAMQASRAQRLAIADDVVNNDNGPSALHEQVDKLHQHYLDIIKNLVK